MSNARGLRHLLLEDERHGPLPGLLLILTVVTGLVDAVSVLALGRVFVANMTGNIVFAGFALAGAPGFSLLASLVALIAFIAGAFVGGTALLAQSNRGKQLQGAASVQGALVVTATVVAGVGGNHAGSFDRYSVIVLLGIAMGIQNSTVSRLKVPNLTTTVLTMTLTGLASETRRLGLSHPVVQVRVLSVAAMFAGAVVGALLILHAQIWQPLALASALLAGVALATLRFSRSEEPWQHLMT